MNGAVRDITARLDAFKRAMPRFRMGIVIATGPLEVALGGSDSTFTGVRSLAAVDVDDTVACLTFGNDMLVLGVIADGSPDTIAGTISGAGAVVAGAGFSVSRTSTGVYSVTFTNEFTSAPAVIVGAGSSGGAYAVKVSTAPTTTGFAATAYAPPPSGNVDGEWHFVASRPG